MDKVKRREPLSEAEARRDGARAACDAFARVLEANLAALPESDTIEVETARRVLMELAAVVTKMRARCGAKWSRRR